MKQNREQKECDLSKSPIVKEAKQRTQCSKERIITGKQQSDKGLMQESASYVGRSTQIYLKCMLLENSQN